jgi:hypothetical protein
MNQRFPFHLTWSEATFLQAYFDLRNGQRLFEQWRSSEAFALAMAQFQQSAEKSMKAMVLLDNKQKNSPEDAIIMTHTIWQDRICHDEQLRGIRSRLLKMLIEEDIIELEVMAPQGSMNSVNTEYPWTNDQGTIVIPAIHFAESDSLVEKRMRVAKAIFEVALSFSSKFEKIRNSVDKEFGKLVSKF